MTPSFSPLDCGARIKFARESKGMSICGAAASLKWDRSAYKRIENGRGFPSGWSLRCLCQALGVSADYLLGLDEPLHALTGGTCCDHYEASDPTFTCSKCHRLVGYCQGGSDDDLCADCWCKVNSEAIATNGGAQ